MLKISNLFIKYSNNILFENFNLSINENDFIGIYAPTGSGKSTLLNYIAGLIQNESTKHSLIQGNLKVKQGLKISYIFQEPRLIDYLSVIKNVTLPLENLYTKDESTKIAQKYLEQTDILEKANILCSNLSGGQKQRVSIARAFSYPFDLILMDEPFHSQDKKHKEKLISLTKKQLELQNKAAVIVSHNLNDLKKMCTSIITEKDFIIVK